MRLNLLGAALDVSNAVKDGKCLRYKKGWRERNYNQHDFVTAFLERLSIVKEDLCGSKLPESNREIIRSDFRKFGGINKSIPKFKLCITSPPYLNSFDYTDVYRPELFLGKFVQSQEELRELRLHTVRSHVQADWQKPSRYDFGEVFRKTFLQIDEKRDKLWNSRIPLMIQAYFEDMETVLNKLKKMASKNASVWIVVSTSSYAGIEIPVDLIIAEIALRLGWSLREVTVLRYLRRVSGQQWSALSEIKSKPHLRESVIILNNGS